MSKTDYRNGDFKAYYCKKNNRHYWVLGYFGGGSINFSRYEKAAKDFAEKTGLPIESVQIDEIFKSRRFKGFKYLFSNAPNQQPIEESKISEDVWSWLSD